MFRKFTILCSLGISLVLLTLIACDSGSTGGGESSTSNRPSSSSYALSSVTQDGSIAITGLTVRLGGTEDQNLFISANIYTDSDTAIGKVVVKLCNNTTVLDKSPNGDSYDITDERYQFQGEDLCGTPCKVYVEAYMNNKLKAREEAEFTRAESKCRIPSSSSVPSSSSSEPAVNLSLSPLFNGETVVLHVSASGNKGFKLSDGSLTTNQEDADLYPEIGSAGCFLATQGSVKITDEFVGIDGNLKDDELPPNTVSNTTQVVFASNAWSVDAIYDEMTYYVVCPSAKTKWDNTCYLVKGDGTCYSTGDRRIGIKVWKAQ